MRKIPLLLAFFILAAGTFISCKKEKSCEGCKEDNKPPIAIAGPDRAITLPTDSISLDGSASNDPDGTINEWLWKKIEGPASFNIVVPTKAKTVSKNLVAGTYQFELSVKDDKGLSAKDTMQVTVNSVTPINRPPVANAGADETITLPASTVTLDGSASTDPDNNITSYQWTKISGPSSSIANANSVQTQITNLAEGVYQFELRVTDAGGLMAKDTIQITVNAAPPPETDRDIYVAGYEYNGSSIQVAKYWKNRIAVTLTDGTNNAAANSIAVVGSDVYVAGYETNGNDWRPRVAKYWKNGQEFALNDGTNYAEASSIAVVGSDVYVAGYETNGSNIPVAKYWKNGIAVLLTNGIYYAGATDIAIVGSDVYVSGFEGKFAKYWKNGQEFVLNDGTKWAAVANSIAIAGSDVYVAGNETDGGIYVVKYWKNGIAVSLIQGYNADATSIAVVGGNVYVAGYNDWRIPGAKYWKNGQYFVLSDPQNWADAMDIAVAGSDVYVAGSESVWGGNHWKAGVAKYWKNGVAVALTDGTKSAFAHSIVVVQR